MSRTTLAELYSGQAVIQARLVAHDAQLRELSALMTTHLAQELARRKAARRVLLEK